MPDLTVTFTVDQVTRIKNALNVSTAAEVEAILKEYLRGRVLDEEIAAERAKAVPAAETTLDAEGWNE